MLLEFTDTNGRPFAVSIPENVPFFVTPVVLEGADGEKTEGCKINIAGLGGAVCVETYEEVLTRMKVQKLPPLQFRGMS